MVSWKLLDAPMQATTVIIDLPQAEVRRAEVIDKARDNNKAANHFKPYLELSIFWRISDIHFRHEEGKKKQEWRPKQWPQERMCQSTLMTPVQKPHSTWAAENPNWRSCRRKLC
jgi:hypothetical protein